MTTRSIAGALGFLFVIIGTIGFASPSLAGLHLSAAHNMIHLVSGLLVLYYVMQDSLDALKSFCQGFGAFYFVLGLAGYIFGSPGASWMAGMASDPKLLSVIPSVLEFGQADHNLHLLLGAIFLYIGFKGRGVAAYRQRRRAKIPAGR